MNSFIAGMAFCLLLFYAGPLSGQSVTDEYVWEDSYGEWQESSLDTVSVAQVATNPAMHGKEVLIAGEIIDVCQKKGCWLVVSDGTSQMRVTFKDYGFFVPIYSSDKKVLIQGVVSEEEIPEDMAKHYAEESKGEDPDAISGPQKVVTMVATGVVIY